MIRNIVHIDEAKCNGCGQCVTACAEGAIKLINGKAKLVSDVYCDGLGACLGECPQGAITIIKREAPDFDEEAVKEHLSEEQDEEKEEAPCCPGSRMMDFRGEAPGRRMEAAKQGSELRQWPVQLTLVSPNAPYFKNADLVVAADCVPFAYPNFHPEFLRGRALAIGCPKLDDAESHVKKLSDILRANNIRSVHVVNMEVPCCFGLQHVVEEAIKKSGKVIPLRQSIISVRGEKQ